MRRQTWRNWLGASLGLVAVVIVSIRYIDRPLARLTGSLPLFHHLFTSGPVSFPILVILASVAIMLALGHRFLGKPFSRWMTAGTIAGLALILSVMLTEYGLKFVFGRTLPSAYLQSGQYGFHWFHEGAKFGSFPSGHTDQAAAILSVLWVFYPRWRWAYVVGLCSISFALVAGQWHFLSDIIAGGYVGTVAGAATMSIWNAVLRRRRDPTNDGSTIALVDRALTGPA